MPKQTSGPAPAPNTTPQPQGQNGGGFMSRLRNSFAPQHPEKNQRNNIMRRHQPVD